MAVPSVPATFTKFPASLAGPFDDIEIVGGTVDWEVELVAVIGTRADRVDEADAWSHVAGLTVGQDISDRTLQFAAGSQFSLGKSRRGYGPMGPWLVTLDEVPNPDDLALGCSVDGETVQDARTSDLIFGVPRLDRRAVGGAAAPSRRRHLHRHARRHRRHPAAAAVPAAGPGARDVDRGHRHDPQPLRVTTDVGVPRYDADLFTDDVLDDPYPHLRALRDAGPVVWLDAHGMYAATRYADVRRILDDHATFVSGAGRRASTT